MSADLKRTDAVRIIRLADGAEQTERIEAAAPPPPPPPPPLSSGIGEVQTSGVLESADQANDLVGQARLVLEAACQQVEDMIGSARRIIAKAEAEAASIVHDAQESAYRIMAEARTTAASTDRMPTDVTATVSSIDANGNPPAPQKKSFAAMWARADEEAGSVDDFLSALDSPSSRELAKHLAPRWRQT